MRRSFISLPLLFISNMVMAQGDKILASQDQILIMDLFLLIEESHELNGFIDDQADLSTIIEALQAQSTDATVIFNDRNTYHWLRSQVNELMLKTDSLNIQRDNNIFKSSSNAQFLSDPEPLPACTAVTPDSARVALGVHTAADKALKSAEFPCLQTVLAENLAANCIYFEVAAQTASSGYDFADFCYKESVYAFDFSTFDVIKDLVSYMNDKIDETKTSTRATATSTQDLQDSLDLANTNLNNNLPLLNNKLNTALSDLTSANNQANNINAQASSLLQRVQINQIEIENIALTSSDTQQLASEIRTDTLSLITSLDSIHSQINQSNSETKALIKVSNDSQIEMVLARNPAKANLTYQVPNFKGGLLDSVRELIATKIEVIQEAGGKTNLVEELFVSGNANYNNQQFKAAYINYSQAYQALKEVKF